MFRLEAFLSNHRVPREPHGFPTAAGILQVILELVVAWGIGL